MIIRWKARFGQKGQKRPSHKSSRQPAMRARGNLHGRRGNPRSDLEATRWDLEACTCIIQKKTLLEQKWPIMASLPMSQSGLKWSRLITNGQSNLSLVIWDHFWPFCTFLDLFRPKSIVFLKNTNCLLVKVLWSKKINFCLKWSKRVQLGLNGPKWSNTYYIDHLGPFGPFQIILGLASLPCFAIFGPKRALLDPFAHMIEE